MGGQRDDADSEGAETGWWRWFAGEAACEGGKDPRSD